MTNEQPDTPESLLDADGRIAARRKRRIKTPPIQEAAASVLNAFESGCASSMLVGKPRLGKTFGARWICEAIAELFAPIFWFEIPFQIDTSQSEGKFFQHVLSCLPHSYLKNRERGVVRARTEEFLIERASDSPSGTVILLLDEAQNLTPRHWTYLAELSNKIDRANLSLFTLSTGLKSLYVMRNSLRELPTEQNGDFIIGRFFVDMNNFRGLRNKDDVQLTLSEIDLSPLGPNDKSLWVQAALPAAYQSGWRIEQLAGIVWEAYSAVWNDSGRKDNMEIPMTFFDLLVRQILSSPKIFNHPEPKIGFDVIKGLVVKTQFLKYIK